MKDMNRRSFMKMLAGVTAAIGVTGKAEKPKYKVSYDPGEKSGSKSVTKKYDLIADLVEEMNGFDKKLPHTIIFYYVHCNYTGLAFLKDTGCLERDDFASLEKYKFWIPYKHWRQRTSFVRYMPIINVIVRPNITVDIGLFGQYSNRRNITNKLENNWTLVTTRRFNVNRDEEGKIIAGLESGQRFIKAGQFAARCKEAVAKGQLVTRYCIDKNGVMWVKPIKDFYKNGRVS